MKKPLLDLESAHQAGRFEYKNIYIGQIEVAMSSASINSCDVVEISINIAVSAKTFASVTGGWMELVLDLV